MVGSLMKVEPDADSQARWQADDAEELRYRYPLKPGDIVIDLGAYRGEWANTIKERYGCEVIAVEPTDMIDGYQGRIIKSAAATYDGTMQFGGAYYYTSAYEDPTHQLPCFDINTLLEEFDEIALLKINIEGGDYNVLTHILKAGLHKRIKYMQVQFHRIEGMDLDSLYQQIANELSNTHQMEWCYPFCWESWERAEFLQ
jgi:hypothetical protein